MSKTMSPSWATVGATVIYCEDTEPPNRGVDDEVGFDLEDGGDYVIRDILWSDYFGEPYVLLDGIRHRPSMYLDSSTPYEWGYLLRYFRPPVSEQMSMDIAMIKRLIEPSTILERLDAALERLG